MTVARTRTQRTKDYAAIARESIREPDGDRPPRIMVYSRNKKGKTRFSMTAPNVLFIDPEHGTDPYPNIIKKYGVQVWPVDTWEQMDDIYGYLKTVKHSYQWVAVDGSTKVHTMALRWVMNQAMEKDLDRRPDQIGKQDYGRAGRMMEQMFHNFNSLPIGVIYTAQERMVEMSEQSDEDEDAESVGASFVADLPRGARGALNSIVDVIGRLYTVKALTKIKVASTGDIREEMRVQRRLWLEPHPSYDTGYRSEFVLPPYLKNPTVPALVRLIKEGAKKNG